MLAMLGLGLVAILLADDEKPSELDPTVWDTISHCTAVAMDERRAGRGKL